MLREKIIEKLIEIACGVLLIAAGVTIANLVSAFILFALGL